MIEFLVYGVIKFGPWYLWMGLRFAGNALLIVGGGAFCAVVVSSLVALLSPPRDVSETDAFREAESDG